MARRCAAEAPVAAAVVAQQWRFSSGNAAENWRASAGKRVNGQRGRGRQRSKHAKHVERGPGHMHMREGATGAARDAGKNHGHDELVAMADDGFGLEQSDEYDGRSAREGEGNGWVPHQGGTQWPVGGLGAAEQRQSSRTHQ